MRREAALPPQQPESDRMWVWDALRLAFEQGSISIPPDTASASDERERAHHYTGTFGHDPKCEADVYADDCDCQATRSSSEGSAR